MRAHLRLRNRKGVQRLRQRILRRKVDDHIIGFAQIKVHRPHKLRGHLRPRTIHQHRRLLQLNHLRRRIRMMLIKFIGNRIRPLRRAGSRNQGERQKVKGRKFFGDHHRANVANNTVTLKKCGGNNWITKKQKKKGCHTEAFEVRCDGLLHIV